MTRHKEDDVVLLTESGFDEWEALSADNGGFGVDTPFVIRKVEDAGYCVCPQGYTDGHYMDDLYSWWLDEDQVGEHVDD